MTARLALAGLVVAACGGTDPITEAIDSAIPIDAAIDGRDIDASAACTSPDACPWIDAELRAVVAVLSGAQPTPAGVTLVRRSSVSQRSATRDYLVAELARFGLTATLRHYGTGDNVVVHLAPTTGADSGPPIVIGSHFDGVAPSPAAADNATGSAMVIVAAAYLVNRPRVHPVELVWFDQEEAGLIGSGAYVAALAGAPIHSMHNFDMVSMDGDGDHTVELWSAAPALEALYRRHATGRGLVISAVPFEFSDHQSFVERGLPAVGVAEEFVGNDHTPHYHQPTDTLDKIDFTYLASVTRLSLAALEEDVATP